MNRFMDYTFLERLIAQDDAADDLYDHLTENNYDPQDVEWVKSAKIHRANVPISRLKLHPPTDPDKVKRMVKELRSGGKLPRIFVADTGKGPIHIADGGHRALASKEAGLNTIRSFVITHVTDDPKEPWRVLHDQELSNIQQEQEGREKAQEDYRQLTPRPSSTPIGEPPYTQQDPHKPAERYPNQTTMVTLKPSDKQLRVRVLDTPALRKTGMTNTDDLGSNIDGLLFKWPGTETQATLHNAGVDFPVSAAFFDESGMYRDHFHLLPNDSTPKTAGKTHKYALEVHSRDWDSLGIGPNSEISIGEEKNGQNDPLQFGDTTSPGVIQ